MKHLIRLRHTSAAVDSERPDDQSFRNYSILNRQVSTGKTGRRLTKDIFRIVRVVVADLGGMAATMTDRTVERNASARRRCRLGFHMRSALVVGVD